jgi:hypothetical protein
MGKGCKGKQAKRGKGYKGKQAKRGEGCKGKARLKLHGSKARKLMNGLRHTMKANDFQRKWMCTTCWEHWQAIMTCPDIMHCSAENLLNAGVLLLCGARYAHK